MYSVQINDMLTKHHIATSRQRAAASSRYFFDGTFGEILIPSEVTVRGAADSCGASASMYWVATFLPLPDPSLLTHSLGGSATRAVKVNELFRRYRGYCDWDL
ncbi:hypothetical protein E2C01_040601 [Portunus trituberculatus]|uniref:Uncharacterized protein n=1 Tax=Portunus trituberculatus TaxID=210409 RepID=A0A5B7FHV0_PORTR|nr:hypothetical protein [Portunus trituberculatus]